jgi:RNA polymerase sigma factor (sigma-70 family)
MNSTNKTDCGRMAAGNVINFKDDGTFEVLYKNYWESLLGFARKYIADRETCKEIVQELFIALHLKRNKLTIHVSLSSYLFRSLRNKIINHLRNESVYKKHLAVAGRWYATGEAGNEAEQWMAVYDLEKQIISCLNKMPVKYREVYILTMQKMYTAKMTAAILQRPVATVERHLRIAIRLLQEHLNKCRVHLQ